MWTLSEEEYLPLPDNRVIVGPKSIRVHSYGFDAKDDCYVFSIQLYRYYDFCGESEKFEDYVKTGPLPPELKPLS